MRGGIYSCDVLGISSFNSIAYIQTTDYISEKVGELSKGYRVSGRTDSILAVSVTNT